MTARTVTLAQAALAAGVAMMVGACREESSTRSPDWYGLGQRDCFARYTTRGIAPYKPPSAPRRREMVVGPAPRRGAVHDDDSRGDGEAPEEPNPKAREFPEFPDLQSDED